MNNDGRSESQTIPAQPPVDWRSLRSVFGLIALFWVLGLACYNYYPAVWCDEASYSEPAINFATKGSYHTYLSYIQPVDSFSVVNCPGYFLVLGPWVKVVGTSLLAVRAFNYTLMAIATALLCVALLRFGLVQSRGALWILVTVLHLGYGMCYAYRCSRPDVMGLVCLLLLLLAASVRRNHLRWGGLFGVACATVWFGVQVGFFAGFACVSAWLLLPWVRWKDVLAVALGGVVGTGSMLLFLASKGVLKYFLATMFAIVGRRYDTVAVAQPSLLSKVTKIALGSVSSYVEDFSAAPLIAGALILTLLFWKRFRPVTRRLIVFLLVLVAGSPVLFNLIGHWAMYYSYMKFIPAVLALWVIGAELSRLEPQAYRQWYRPLTLLLAIVAMLVGLPLRVGLVLKTSKLMPRAEIQKIVARNVKPDDVVYTDYATFFEVKQIARIVYTSWSSRTLQISRAEGRDLTPAERAEISVLIVRPRDVERLTKFMGGEWHPIGEPFGDTQDYSALTRLPLVGRRLSSYSTQPQSERYPVQILRRVAVAQAVTSPPNPSL